MHSMDNVYDGYAYDSSGGGDVYGSNAVLQYGAPATVYRQPSMVTSSSYPNIPRTASTSYLVPEPSSPVTQTPYGRSNSTDRLYRSQELPYNGGGARVMYGSNPGISFSARSVRQQPVYLPSPPQRQPQPQPQPQPQRGQDKPPKKSSQKVSIPPKQYPQGQYPNNYQPTSPSQKINQPRYPTRGGISRRSVTMIVAGILLVLLLVGVGIGVYMYLSNDRNSQEVEIQGEFTIQQKDWSPKLTDPSSKEYLTLKSQICTELTGIMTTALDKVEGCNINSFSSGSIIVAYTLIIQMKRGIASTENSLHSQAASRITNGLIASKDFRIDQRDIKFFDGDQCADDPCPEAQQCFDLEYNYKCGCGPGYDLLQNTQECRDIDECLETKPCDHSCKNIVGSFICSCDDGYTLAADGRICQDIQECADVNFDPGCEHTCVDEIPSYRCACNKGYALNKDGKNCDDIDECATGVSGCDDKCSNTAGGYTCSCNAGYYLWLDGHTCKPEFAALTTAPIGVDQVRVLQGSTTVLGCSMENKDPDVIKQIRWSSPNGDVIAVDKLAPDTDITMASQYDSIHKASLLGFVDQYGKPTTVLPGVYKCSITVGDFTRSLNINVMISDCSSSSGYVMCQDKKHCILKSQLCDGVPHCPTTGDDEILHCNTETVVSQCSGFHCEDGGCIGSAQTCDGLMQCADGSDEKNCDCSAEHYECDDGVCLSMNRDEVFCNRYPECPDRSDEPAQCECQSSQHFCDGKCRPDSIVCDEIKDCVDGSDESDERNCNCQPGEFQCGNGNCVLLSQRMDKVDDCGDGTDELPPACSSNEFQCADSHCIPLQRVGDKINDCADWSDEITDDCPDDTMHCDNGACLWKSAALYYCDGQEQCPDGSDEPADCSCLPEKQHDCGDHCIPIQWVGDGDFDCTDKSDETIRDFSCTEENIYLCPGSGKCIPLTWLCDGHEDCTDGSDENEAKCDTGSEQKCDPNEFQCPTTGAPCIRMEETCDFTNHCGDHADELLDSCPPCTEPNFQCSNGACISEDMKCDGNKDCPDGEDEKLCPCDEFLCPDGRCIPKEWECDHVDDCNDGYDEKQCGTCRQDQFQCNSYACIAATKQCDGNNDCEDTSDEFNCAKRTSLLDIVVLTSRSVESPVCSYNWKTRWGNNICSMIGMGIMTSSSATPLPNHSAGYLIPTSTASPHLDITAFKHSSTCATNAVVTIQCQSLGCGAPSRRLGFTAAPYIIRGESADIGEWPWQVALRYNDQFKCGAVLISEQWIVTAAHCVEKDIYNVDRYSMKAGSILRSGRGTGSVTQQASAVFMHPKYQPSTIEYDIALIKLSAPLVYSDYIRPICLHDAEDNLDHFIECYATGWGKNSNDEQPEQLHEAKMMILSAQRCNDDNTISTQVEDATMICAGYWNGRISTCKGDSGGPLACKDHHGLWTVVGLTSWGNTDCSAFTVFTRVSVFKDWITTKMAMHDRK